MVSILQEQQPLLKDSRLITDRLGAYDTGLSIMREFFPSGDLEKGAGPEIG